MAVSRALQLTTRNRRKALTYIFGATAFTSVLTVAGSEVLPCPARPGGKSRYADGSSDVIGSGSAAGAPAGKTVVEKRPRRWIEESRPALSS